MSPGQVEQDEGVAERVGHDGHPAASTFWNKGVADMP
jgi:hypothetical protein